MKELPVVDKMEGLSLAEMIKLAGDADSLFWFKFERYDERRPFEITIARDFYGHGKHDFWFSYDYGWQSQGMDIYLSNNSGGSLWSNYVALRVMREDTALGFSGRLKESKCLEIRNLCMHVCKCVEINKQNLELSKSQWRSEILKELRSRAFSE